MTTQVQRIEGNPIALSIESGLNAGSLVSPVFAWTPASMAKPRTRSVAYRALFALFAILAGLGFASASMSAVAFANGEMAVAIGFLGPTAGAAGGLLALFWRVSADMGSNRRIQ